MEAAVSTLELQRCEDPNAVTVQLCVAGETVARVRLLRADLTNLRSGGIVRHTVPDDFRVGRPDGQRVRLTFAVIGVHGTRVSCFEPVIESLPPDVTAMPPVNQIPTLNEHLLSAYRRSFDAGQLIPARHNGLEGYVRWCEEYLDANPPTETFFPGVGVGLVLANHIRVVMSRSAQRLATLPAGDQPGGQMQDAKAVHVTSGGGIGDGLPGMGTA